MSIHKVNGRSHGIVRDGICEDVPLNTLKIFNDQNLCGKFVACIGQVAVHYKCFNNAVYGNGTSDCLMCNKTSFLHVYQDEIEKPTKINPTKKIPNKKLRNPKTRKTTENYKIDNQIMTTLAFTPSNYDDNQSSKQIDYTAVNDNVNIFDSEDYQTNNTNDYHDDSLSNKYQQFIENSENIDEQKPNQIIITTENISNSNPKPTSIDTNELSISGQSSIIAEYTTMSLIDNYSSERDVIIRKIDSNPIEILLPNEDYSSTTTHYEQEGSTKISIDNESNTETVWSTENSLKAKEFEEFNTISNKAQQNDNELTTSEVDMRLSETESTSETNDNTIDNRSSISLVYDDISQELNDQKHSEDQIIHNKDFVPRNEISSNDDEIEDTCFAFHEGGGRKKKILERIFNFDTSIVTTENQNNVIPNESFSTFALPIFPEEEQSINDSRISQSSHLLEGENLDASSNSNNSSSQDLIDAEEEKKSHEKKFSEFFANKTTPTKFTKTRKVRKSRAMTKSTTEIPSFNNSK